MISNNNELNLDIIESENENEESRLDIPLRKQPKVTNLKSEQVFSVN